MSDTTDSLQTIQPDGVVPETRMKDASAVQAFAWRLTINDNQRSYKRARVNGLVDGNPPYKLSKLRELGRADAANFNTGEAKAYMDAAAGAIYDLFSEAPTFITVKCNHGTDEEKEVYSGVLTEEADRCLRENSLWDYNNQISIWEKILHGCGPLMFENAETPMPKAFHCGNLKVPEFTPSDTSYWDAGCIIVNYYPPQLYAFIKDEKAATEVGWNVAYTKKVIARAMNIILANHQVLYDWEALQQELKNNSMTYYDDSKVCRLACAFWKEFDGTITYSIVQHLEEGVGAEAKDSGDAETTTGTQYLFFKRGRYKSYDEFIHPMYYDHGNGGYHHSVTGLGVKMYSLMEYKNRMVTNACDKAASPKIIFKPSSNDNQQKFSMVHYGDWAVIPGGFDWAQTGVAGVMGDVLGMNEKLTQIARSNLSEYRQQPMEKEGNPITAKQVMYEASQSASLSKTPVNRYYQQMDRLYAEIYRRLSKPSTSDPIAKEFQKRCMARGVPKEAISKPLSVQATRVIGQGSAFMRVSALDNLWITIGPSLPEDGRENLINDQIAAKAGQAMVTRYNPQSVASKLPSDQEAEAFQWVAAMKVGVPPVVTPTQNPVIYATIYLSSAIQALQSVQKGANPTEVIQFLDVCAPATWAQMQRFANDPSRKQVADQLMAQFKKLAGMTDQLRKQVQQQVDQNAQQQQKTMRAMSDEEIATAQAKSDIARKDIKLRAQLKQSEEKQRVKLRQAQQDAAIKDAMAATDIRLKAAQSKTSSNGR